MKNAEKKDYDWIVIGSGFGGSVSALRLTEKGYKVGVLECGRRFQDSTVAKSFWNVPKILWAPWIKFFGIIRLTNFKHVAVLSGSSVGGGSLAYAATLYRARDHFYAHAQWKNLANWKEELAPHYDTAEHMLGVSEIPFDQPIDDLLKDFSEEFSCADSYQKARAGIYFGGRGAEQGAVVSDPYFDGDGPDRTVCIRCAACMQGCPFGAKNTLMKNYLWFAEKNAAEIQEKRTVVDIKPLGAEDGSDGYEIETVKSGAIFFKQRQRLRTRGVVLSSGAVGTNRLMGKMRLNGSLPALSEQVNKKVRTNSETLLAVVMPSGVDYSQGVPIPASTFPDENTHVEMVTAGRWGSAFSLLNTVMTPAASAAMKPLVFLRTVLRHPLWFLRSLWPAGKNKRSVSIGIMQGFDQALSFRIKKGLFGRTVMDTEMADDNEFPSSFPAFDAAVQRFARKYSAIPQASVFEAVMGKPVTAHLIGGQVIGKNAETGVVDQKHRVFNYENFLICDGSAIPANLGVNPSLTITAMAERAMSFVPEKTKRHDAEGWQSPG